MSGAAWWSLALLAASAASGQESSVAPEDVAFVELSSPRARYFEHEPFRVTLCFGLEREFARSRLIQLASRELDVPVEVGAAWIDELPGAERVVREAPDAPGERATFALNGEIARAPRAPDRERGKSTYLVLELEEAYVARQPGELVVPPASLRFAFATRFEQDFFGEEVASGRQVGLVTGEPLALRIEPLPAEGRPAGFTNAVGRFEVSATAEPRELALGDTLRLVLRIEGEGNLALLEVPRLELAGFHVLGSVEERSPSGIVVTADLSPLDADVRAVPVIELPYFDPGAPPGYRSARTLPIAVSVHPDEESAVSDAGAEPRAGSGPIAPEVHAPGSSPWIAAGLGAALLGAAGILWALRRRRAGHRADPALVRARRAAAVFQASAGSDAANAYAEYLAAQLACSPAAVIAPDLARRLAARGASGELSLRSAHALDRLVAARYGGPSDVTALELALLVRELDLALDGRRQPRS